MSTKIQVDFEEIQTVRQAFAAHGELAESVHRQIVQTMENLRGGAWMGEGATRFYAEMDELVLPALQRWADSMYMADEIIHNIENLFLTAEEEACVPLDQISDQGGKASPPAKIGAETGNGKASGGMIHTVRPGDTLWDIGQRHGVTVDELMAANPHITDRDLIFPGQEITIPGKDAPPPAAKVPSGGGPVGGSELWSDWVGRTSNRMQGWGCVAYVLNSAYLPWVTPSASPGNAIDFIGRAETWAAANPEYGVTIDRTPRDGAIAVYPNMGNGYGHVGIVSGADGNQYLLNSGNTWHGGNTVSQGNWYDNHGNLNGVNVDRMTVATGGANDVWFIHLPWNQV